MFILRRCNSPAIAAPTHDCTLGAKRKSLEGGWSEDYDVPFIPNLNVSSPLAAGGFPCLVLTLPTGLIEGEIDSSVR